MINLTGKTLEITNGFDIKDDLKAAGYTWDAWGKFWGKQVNSVDELVSEVDRLTSLGEDTTEFSKYIEIMRDPSERPTGQQTAAAYEAGINPSEFIAMWGRAKAAAKLLGGA